MRYLKLASLFLVIAIASLGCTGVETSQPSMMVLGEVEARDSIGSILFDQRTYYIENDRFTVDIKDLRKSSVSTDSQNYTYRLNPKQDRNSGVVITASPRRPNLRSFTGVVFAIPTNAGPLMVSEICESVDPSQKPPTTPAIPKRPSDTIQCPAGSRSAFAVVAEG